MIRRPIKPEGKTDRSRSACRVRAVLLSRSVPILRGLLECVTSLIQRLTVADDRRTATPYLPTSCNCHECHFSNDAYAPSTSYTYRASTPTAGLSYPFNTYQAQPQPGLQAPQPVYRLPPRPLNSAYNTVLPPVPSGMTLPSPPIEDRMPHLAQLPTYQSTWSPGEPPAQMQLPERTSYSRPISRDRPSTSYLPRASPDSPHLRANAALEPVPLQRRQSSGSTQYETALSRRSSALSLRSPLDSPYGSEYSFGAEDLDERAETATPFATKVRPHKPSPPVQRGIADNQLSCAQLNYLVNNPDLDEVIRWDASGTAFVFAHSAEALSSALSRVFRHGNTHSFVRQLNICPSNFVCCHAPARLICCHILQTTSSGSPRSSCTTPSSLPVLLTRPSPLPILRASPTRSSSAKRRHGDAT